MSRCTSLVAMLELNMPPTVEQLNHSLPNCRIAFPNRSDKSCVNVNPLVLPPYFLEFNDDPK
jgi:hypothetical protein